MNKVSKANKDPKGNLCKSCERFLDILLSSIALVIGIPLILLFGILIRLDTSGPIFYSQERLGKEGKRFKICKLRSMRYDAEKDGAQWAEKNDVRVTRIGRIIRKTRIDEIPQLFNILKGDMSVIGPRPERPEFTLEFEDEIPGFINRLQIRPGLTGWAQVNGGYDLTPREKLELDMYYINNRSIKMDIIIIFKTIKIVLTGDGSR